LHDLLELTLIEVIFFIVIVEVCIRDHWLAMIVLKCLTAAEIRGEFGS
jgi:hypothetical protein